MNDAPGCSGRRLITQACLGLSRNFGRSGLLESKAMRVDSHRRLLAVLVFPAVLSHQCPTSYPESKTATGDCSQVAVAKGENWWRFRD